MSCSPPPAPLPTVTLPPLTRGARYRRIWYTVPLDDYAGKVFQVLFDHPTAGSAGRITVNELVGTGSDDEDDDVTGVVHADDETFVTITLSSTDTEAFDDGATYVVTLLIDLVHVSSAYLPVYTPPGGVV